MNLTDTLLALPGSYAGPTAPLDGPHAVLGLGEGALPADLLTTFTDRRLSAGGTQFILSSAETSVAAADYANLGEASGARIVRAGEGPLDALSFLVPRGVTSTYHYAQFTAHATGHADAATRADALMRDLAERCAPHIEDGNPARELAWSLWGRTPMLLAASGDAWLTYAWQTLLARIGKTLSIPVERDPLYILTGAFEARHETGDGRVALLLGHVDPELALAREVLETRIDEVIHVPYTGSTDDEDGQYAAQLAHWYFAAWVAHYLAERHGVSSEDASPLREVLRTLGGETPAADLN
ncbi:SIS domain-containing protein [Deinococcus maricopensis]|uniref:Phosphosugar isomerase n=1 Tax=Deinococcus maricopensis (strain DSM 21211 / LMG 22137 / NRRL B-23946 / LB-34) TaxID=709986 RepID=E8U7C8_DEIML|nr:SIS domain-containing protein [Deinococcus maricopensis]ADV66967.1 hypothetical protein Deima_1316 [Deinococcus maricopensis DSM 21211]